MSGGVGVMPGVWSVLRLGPVILTVPDPDPHA